MPSSSDPAGILALLAEPAKELLVGLDDGVSFADLTMDRQPHDPYIWAILVRYRACNVIAPKAKKRAWSFRQLANCGLEFQHGPYRVRVLRSLDDNPPHPGRSTARQRFYKQDDQYQMSIFDLIDTMPDGTETNDASIGANLIIDWTIGENREILMALSKTEGVWPYKGEPTIEWRKPIKFDDNNTPGFEGTDDTDIETPRWDENEFDKEEEGDAG